MLDISVYMLAFSQAFNPLTTNDAIWCHLSLAACYQLAQSVLNIGFALAKIGGGGLVHPQVPCTWQLAWLAREEPWSAVPGPFLALLAQMCSGLQSAVHMAPALAA